MQVFSSLPPELPVLAATFVLLVASYRHENRPNRQKEFRLLFGIVAAMSIAAFFNFGTFHGEEGFVHKHEQFHFFLGSKYLEEVRYDAIYEASILAAVENGTFETTEIVRRDPATFAYVLHEIAPDREAELRDRFTADRWNEYRADVQWFGDGREYLIDHGNTGSPAWAMMAGIFTRHVSMHRTSARMLGTLDLLLLTLLFWTVWRTFGERTLSLALIVGMSIPVLFGYLGGSILRMDWIVALGVSICLFEKRHFRSAGILLGYAVAVKLIAGIFVLPFGLRFLVELVQRRGPNRGHLRYILFAWIGLAIFVLASTLYFADLRIWQEYFERLLLTWHQHFYRGQHSFRDLFLQAYYDPGNIWNPFPSPIFAAQPQVSINALRGLYTAVQTVLLVGLVFVAARNPARYAFALGPLAIFVILVTNRYYWQTWTLAAIALAPTYRMNWRHAAYLCLIVAWLAAGQVLPLPALDRWRGYSGSYGLIWIGAAVLGVEIVAWWRERHRATRSVSA